MNAAYLKFAAMAGLFALWAGLVCTGHADPDLIGTIKDALVALGAYHVGDAVGRTRSPRPPAPTTIDHQ